MKPQEILEKYWGHKTFRSLQEDIIASVLNKKDTLALLPTGGGKSICFQVPALCVEGLCLVVSPLIALMKDQVFNLRKKGIEAYALYAGQSRSEMDRILDNCAYGQVKFLYLSPERLKSQKIKERIKGMNVSLLAIDEAHCISQWGYDFRPAYLEISEIRAQLKSVPVIALTATATDKVVGDIQKKLLFDKDAQVFQKSFSRSNLSYVVVYEENKMSKMLEILNTVQGSAVIYVQNRKACRDIAYFLYQRGISAEYYHAGRSGDIREKVQQRWIDDEVRVIVATNAFGMGIDKPDVRLVIHLSLPESLEAYFQEAGRAGRDERKAFAVLLYNGADRLALNEKYDKSYPELKFVKKVYQALGSYFQIAVGAGEGSSFDFELPVFCKQYQMDPVSTLNALKILVKEGYVFLTEAVYEPSKLKIIIAKDQLYDYLLKNDSMDKLLKMILRNYQGAFDHAISIREGQLAIFLELSQEALLLKLNKLQMDGVIQYSPQKDKPQLIFTSERLSLDNLSFDHKLIS